MNTVDMIDETVELIAIPFISSSTSPQNVKQFNSKRIINACLISYGLCLHLRKSVLSQFYDVETIGDRRQCEHWRKVRQYQSKL